MKLLIVESPSKAKKIQSFLGGGWKVKASVGHVMDLPVKPEKSEFGVDLATWVPEYVISDGKGKVVRELRDAAKEADEIVLATDPDREGEAIAQELKTQLSKIKVPMKRAVWNEITKKAVEEGLAAKRDIDHQLVAAQEARRIVDRLVGYGISPRLNQDLKGRGLSAGRVQSVALRLVVERQRQIDNFVSKPFAGVTLLGRHRDGEVKAELTRVGQDQIVSPKDADKPGRRVLSEADARALPLPKPGDKLTVSAVEKKQDHKAPKAPFTTSELMQAASAALGMRPDRTAKVAQELYQAGAITYIRTDSPALSEDAIAMARSIIEREHGKAFVPQEARRYKAKGNAQEAHEAIRPTHDDAMPNDVKGLGADHERLYQLIWRRFLACQMPDAEFDVTTADLDHGDLRFRATGRVRTFAGWQEVYSAEEDKEDGEADEAGKLPSLKQGDQVESLEAKVVSKKTEPPSPFTEAKLIKELESRGIGRPATYPQIFRTLIDREFVVLKKKGKSGTLHPTELGFRVTDYLMKTFPRYVDYEFTASIESQLDEVAEGKLAKQAILDPFWSVLAQAIAFTPGSWGASAKGEGAADGAKISCFKCKSDLTVRQFDGRHYVKCVKCELSWGTNEKGDSLGGNCPSCKAPIRVTKSGSKVCVGCNQLQDGGGAPAGAASDGPAVKVACFKCKGELQVQKYDGRHYVKCRTCDLSWGTTEKGEPLGGYCPTCKAPIRVTQNKSKVCVGCNTWLTPKPGSGNAPSKSSSTTKKQGSGRGVA